ncbi:unnamed protein product [Rhodiola kirilowii]
MAATCGAEQSTESLERSLRSLSIHDSGGGGVSRETNKSSEKDVITIDLNSETPLPYNWEQCLDLKTGEIYFINRRNGMKTVEDPRGMSWYYYYYSEDEDEDEIEDDDGSSEYETDEDHHNGSGSTEAVNGGEENVLVVAGCRSCLMYYMVSKQVKDCPKCNHQLLFHFADSSQAV